MLSSTWLRSASAALRDPGLALGIGEKAGQFGTVPTAAGERARAPPVGRRRQGFGDPGAQMRDTCGPQPVDRRHALYRAGADQRAGRRNKDGVKAIGLGRCEDVVHAPFGQRWIDQRRGRSGDRRRCLGRPAMGAARAHAARGAPPGRPAVPRPAGWRRPLRLAARSGPQAAAARASRSAQAPRAVVAVPATMRSISAAALRRRQAVERMQRWPRCRPCRSGRRR